MACVRCRKEIHETEARFCPYCGTFQHKNNTTVSAPSHIWKWWRLLLPILALIGSLVPWVRILGPSRTAMAVWNAYSLSPISLAWLVLDLAAVLMALRWSTQGWDRWHSTWHLFGAVSFGVSTSAFVFVRVAAQISSLLGALSPLTLDYGIYLFTAITGLWTLLAWNDLRHRT